jgi:hypothetical protein
VDSQPPGVLAGVVKKHGVIETVHIAEVLGFVARVVVFPDVDADDVQAEPAGTAADLLQQDCFRICRDLTSWRRNSGCIACR